MGQKFSFTQVLSKRVKCLFVREHATDVSSPGVKVFGPDASQRKVFEGSVRGMVQDVLEGGNCLLFTYGVTNAGKTFTFLGEK